MAPQELKRKIIPILDLPGHLLDQFTDPREIMSNLACLAKIISPGSDGGDNDNEAISEDEKITIGNKVGDFMHHRVDKLQSRTDRFVDLLEKMPEGQSKVVTGAAEVGHRAEDVWHKLGSRLKDAGTVEEQQAALEEAMEAITV